MEGIDWSGRSLWRSSTGQGRRCCCSLSVERVTVTLLHGGGSRRAEWVGFGRWLNNPRVTVSVVVEHCGAVVRAGVAAGLRVAGDPRYDGS